MRGVANKALGELSSLFTSAGEEIGVDKNVHRKDAFAASSAPLPTNDDQYDDVEYFGTTPAAAAVVVVVVVVVDDEAQKSCGPASVASDPAVAAAAGAGTDDRHAVADMDVAGAASAVVSAAAADGEDGRRPSGEAVATRTMQEGRP